MEEKLYECVVNRIEQAELFTRKFGTFAKADYELLMFTAYLDSIDENAKDYDLSVALGITESKARTLRVKSQLLYPREIDWVGNVATALKHGLYEDGMITITIEDPNVWNRVKNEIEKKFGTVNLSLNSKHLVLPVESFILLAACAEEDTSEAISNLKSLIRQQQTCNETIETKGFKQRFLQPVSDVASFIENAKTIFEAGKPIIRALLLLIGA